MTLKKLTKSTTGRRESTRTPKRGRRRSKPEAKQMTIPTRGGALAAWKQIGKTAISKSIAMRASTDLPTTKETVQIMAKAQENILVIDPEAEKEQNKSGIGIIIPKERELGAEKDTIKTNRGDGKNADTTTIIIRLMERETVEREGPLTAIKTLTNRVKRSTAGRTRITRARAAGPTARWPEGTTPPTAAATGQTRTTAQHPRSSPRNTPGTGARPPPRTCAGRRRSPGPARDGPALRRAAATPRGSAAGWMTKEPKNTRRSRRKRSPKINTERRMTSKQGLQHHRQFFPNSFLGVSHVCLVFIVSKLFLLHNVTGDQSCH